MKKTTLFTMLLILVLAFPVAAEVNITGEIQPGFITNFSDYALPFFASASEFAFNAKADDFTTVNLTLSVADRYINAAAFGELGGDSTMVPDRSLPAANPGYSDVPAVRFLYFTTDVGGAVGLKDMGVDITVMGGYFRPQNEGYILTWYGPERQMLFRNPATAIDITLGVMNKMINFEVIMNEQVFYANESTFSIDGKAGPQLWAGVFGGIAPIWAELYYYSNYNPDFKGKIGAAAKFAMDIMPDVFMLSATAQFVYDLAMAEDSELNKSRVFMIGAGVRADIMKMLYIALSYAGNDGDIFNLLYSEAGVNYMNMVGADLGLSTSFAEDADALQMVEFSGWVMFGTANKFRIGYLVLSDSLVLPTKAGSVAQVPYRTYSPIAPQKGGLFVRWDAKF
jgi:hypothetical protein